MSTVPHRFSNQQDVFGVAILGAGVVGCAIARMLTLYGFGVVIVEKNAQPISEASSGNSGIFHTGFDAPPGSLEAGCMYSGWREFSQLAAAVGLPYRQTGGLVVAWNEEEKNTLDAILMKAHQNGVRDATRIDDPAELRRMEPALSSAALGAVWIPGEGITDPWLIPAFYLAQAIANGATIVRNFCVAKVEYARPPSGFWTMHSKSGAVVRAKMVVNCSGNFGDHIEKLRDPSFRSFTITPRKGQFVVYDTREQQSHGMVRTLILPVPTERTKGVIVFPTLYGFTVVGPTAEDQKHRTERTTSQETARILWQRGCELIPHLKSLSDKLVLQYAGLRPATEHRDYQITFADVDRAWITVGGIRSTGLTAALGIASHVRRLIEDQLKVSLTPVLSLERCISQGKFIADSLRSQLNTNKQQVIIGKETFEVTHPLTRLGYASSRGAKL